MQGYWLMLKNSDAMARGVRDLATVTRAAEHMRVDLEASVTAVSSWTALMPELIKLSVSDPQSSLALLTATERMLEEVRAVPSSAPDNDDADAFGPDADAADEAQIAAAAARIAAGELTTIPYEVVERLADGKHRVRAWREHRGMTQAELAKRAGLTQGAIADIERSRRSPGVNSLRRIAGALKVPAAQLMD
jgi:DNA-binding XRE family transcriptional regulator